MLSDVRRVALAASLALLTACGDDAATVEQHLSSAARYLEQNDPRAAVIELKAALQLQPENATARARLGRVYLAQGQGAEAVKEIRRARELGAASGELALALAQALVLNASPERALEVVARDGADTADWKVIEADALRAAGRADEARAAYEAALALDAESTAAYRGLARLDILAGAPDAARRRLDAALAARDTETATWLLKGEVEQALNDSAAAEAAFRSALEQDPGLVLAQLGLARALLAQSKTDAAREPLAALESSGLQLPLLHYLRAVEARQRNDLDTAQDALRDVLRIAPDYAPAQLLMGQINLLRRELDQAQSILKRYVAQVPGDANGRKLLAAVQIELDEPRAAVETLTPLDADGEADAQTLSLLGTAWMKLNEPARGNQYLARAAESSPDTTAIRTQLAVGHLAAGDTEAAANELQSVIERDPQFARADFLLVLTRLRQGDTEAAMSAALALTGKHPESAEAYNLLGAVHEAARDRAAARAAYRRSVELDPEGRAGQLNLARLSLADGDVDAARAGFEDVLARHPSDVVSLMGIARIESDAGNTAKALDLLETARRENPTALRPRLVLGSYYLRQRDSASALANTGEAYELSPATPTVALLHGRAQLAAGQPQDAERTFRRLTREAPEAAVAHFHLALAQRANGRADDARRSLVRSLELAPGYHLARATLGQLEITAGRLDEALAAAGQLEGALPDAPAAALLRGDVAMASGDAGAAADHYAAAFEKSPGSVLLRKLFLAEERAGRREQARARVQAWLDEHPTDSAVRSVLAAAMHGDVGADGNDELVAQYEQALESDPDNVVALNNLAWLYHLRGDERALELAQRAYERLPQRAEIVDTYGWLLVQNEQVEQGLALLDQALKAAPTNPDIRYHHAAALLRAGDSARARGLLRALLDEAPEFGEREAAQALFDLLK